MRSSRVSSRKAWTAACAAVTALALALPAASPAARPLVTGVSDPEANALGHQATFNRIRGAGARFVRLTVLWQTVAPGWEPPIWDPANPADPHYDWSVPDREVRMARRAGLTPLFQIYNAPHWAQRCDSGDAPCDPDPAAFAQFAKAAAIRYSGSFRGLPRVRYWEPQNEPNLRLFFNPQYRNGKAVSPRLYRVLLNRFSAAVKSVHRDNLVATAGFAPLGRPGSVAPLKFVRRLLCMRGRHRPRPTRRGCANGVRFDILATNPYTTGGPTHEAAGPDDVSLGDLPELRRLLRAAERAGRIRSDLRRVPFWVTEFSWDSRPPDPGGLRSRLHARWTAEAIFRAWRAGVRVFFWYQIRDSARLGRPHNETVQSGLYLRGRNLAADRPKRALAAFRFPFVALARRNGIFVWGRTPNAKGGRIRIQAWTPQRRWRRVGALRAGRNGVFRGVVRTGYGRGRRGSLRAVVRRRGSLPFSLRYVRDFYQPPFG